MNASETSPQPNEVPFTRWLRNLWLKDVPEEILAGLSRGLGEERGSVAQAPHRRYLPLPRTTPTKQEPAGSNSLHQASLLLKLVTGCRAAAADMARVTIIGRKMLEPSFRERD